MNFVANKTALITGASEGIGKAVALKLASMQTNVILVARNQTRLNAVKNECEKFGVSAKTFALDVRDKEMTFNEFARFVEGERVDFLINNAGLALGLERVDEGDLENWETMIDTNIKGLLYITRLILPKMRTLESAHVVNLGSVAGKVGYPNGNVYCMTKAAVKQLGECLNADLFGTNVKCTTIAPGAVETEFSNTRFKGDKAKAAKTYEGYTPLNAEDIANAILCALNTPPHVNIQYIDIMPTAQRNPFMVAKS